MPDIVLVRVADTAIPPLLKKIAGCQHPMNLVYLATWLRAHGHIPEIVDLEVEPLSNLEKRLKSTNPCLVGITVMTANISQVKRICALCRLLGINTVLGGPHPTALPVQTLQDTGCDYVVLGEGEEPLCNLLSSIKDNRHIEDIKGIGFLQDGIPVVNERPQLIDLDKLPLPDRRFLKLDSYHGHTTPGIAARAAVIFTSRGCPYDCTFCASKVINQQRVRFRNMNSISDEIDDIVSLGFRHLTVDDDTFTLDRDRVKEFCSYLISKYPRLCWDCDSRVDKIDEELLTMMKASNCKKIAFGIESGSPRILKSINKNIDINQVKYAFRLTKKYKISSQAFFMIGYPEETAEDIKATEELINEIEPDLLVLSIVVPLPGTPIYEHMLQKGFLDIKNYDSFVFFGKEVPWRTKYFSGEDLVAIRKRINRKFYLRFPYISRKISSVRNINEIRYLIKAGLAAVQSFLLRKEGAGSKN